MDGLKAAEIHGSQFWRLKFKIGVPAGLNRALFQVTDFSLCPHMIERVRDFSAVSFMRTLISFTETFTTMINLSLVVLFVLWAFLVTWMVKNSPAMQGSRFDPCVGKIPWRWEWQHTPVFLPEEFHGQTMKSQKVRHD